MKTCFAFVFTLIFLNIFAQKTDKKLQQQIEQEIQNFHGSIGLYVHDLNKNKTVAINADTLFPTASTIKIPILIGVMDKINKGELQYHQELIYRDSLLYKGVDILGSFKDSEKIELSKVIMLMLTMSDNTASLWLQGFAGGGLRINQILDSIGIKAIRLNSRTPGREANRDSFGWGQTSPRDMASLMEMIVKKQIISDSMSERMLRLLGRNYWDEMAVSQIPSDVFVADKHGSLDESRSEIMFVNGKGRRYIFCIYTNNIKDQSWNPDNEAWVLTRKLSKLVWDWYK